MVILGKAVREAVRRSQGGLIASGGQIHQEHLQRLSGVNSEGLTGCLKVFGEVVVNSASIPDPEGLAGHEEMK